MQPRQLMADTFKSYPPKGRALAVTNLALLQSLPLAFVPFLLKDLIAFDWNFPVEQLELTNQFTYLTGLWEQQRTREMQPFATLKLTRPNGPFFNSEFWAGWFDHWGGPHAHTSTATIPPAITTGTRSGNSSIGTFSTSKDAR